MFIEKRNARSAVLKRYEQIVKDYSEGYKINEIMQRNDIKSPQTIYNAIEEINKLHEEEN